MKAFMKVLMWLGLGAGLGYFLGDQIGYKRGYEEGKNHEQYIERMRKELNEEPPVEKQLKEYLGGDHDGDAIEIWAGDNIVSPPTDEDPDMPTEEEIAIDEDIPQLHPQHFVPEIIGEEEYNANIWNYDLENLVYYEQDDVLFNETTQAPIEHPDEVIGIGTLCEFGGDPNNPTETIYVKNETYGTLFRIDRVDAAFCDAVDGSCGPEDDEEEEDFTKDDYWDDV